MNRKLLYVFLLIGCLNFQCTSQENLGLDDGMTQPNVPPAGPIGPVDPIDYLKPSANLVDVTVHTDKSCYTPGKSHHTVLASWRCDS